MLLTVFYLFLLVETRLNYPFQSQLTQFTNTTEMAQSFTSSNLLSNTITNLKIITSMKYQSNIENNGIEIFNRTGESYSICRFNQDEEDASRAICINEISPQLASLENILIANNLYTLNLFSVSSNNSGYTGELALVIQAEANSQILNLASSIGYYPIITGGTTQYEYKQTDYIYRFNGTYHNADPKSLNPKSSINPDANHIRQDYPQAISFSSVVRQEYHPNSIATNTIGSIARIEGIGIYNDWSPQEIPPNPELPDLPGFLDNWQSVPNLLTDPFGFIRAVLINAAIIIFEVILLPIKPIWTFGLKYIIYGLTIITSFQPLGIVFGFISFILILHFLISLFKS